MDNNNILHYYIRKIRAFKVRVSLNIILLVILASLLLLTTDSLLHAYEKIRHESRNNTEISATSQKLISALREIELLRHDNEDLSNTLFKHILQSMPKNNDTEITKMIQNFLVNLEATGSNRHDITNNPTMTAPSIKYEMTRRNMENRVHEMWHFFGAQLQELKSLARVQTDITPHIKQIIEEGLDHKRILLNNAQMLSFDDGYMTWRERESKDLSSLVQKYLHRLQHPQNCSSERKLICQVKKPCGYACQINHIFYCLVEAIGTRRTMILRSNKWTKYQPFLWKDVFVPVSNCTFSGRAAKWPSIDATVILMDFEHCLIPKPSYLPLGIPRELAPRLARLHGDPAAWWVGQCMMYLLRPQPALTHIIDAAVKRLGFQKPIVGVHIRRSDKLAFEASFHAVEEYMEVVEEYYLQLELVQKVKQRRVFIASDDPSVFEEVKTKFPNYEIIGDQIVSAATEQSRFGNNSLYGIIIDIHLLAHSDFIICTFSSGVCRLAYEIMQTMHPDASAKIRSLDDIYFSSSQVEPRLREVVYQHRSSGPEEIDLDIGDIVEVAGNHWDGYSVGMNRRTGKEGIYPSHKVIEKLELKDFPSFK